MNRDEFSHKVMKKIAVLELLVNKDLRNLRRDADRLIDEINTALESVYNSLED